MLTTVVASGTRPAELITDSGRSADLLELAAVDRWYVRCHVNGGSDAFDGGVHFMSILAWVVLGLIAGAIAKAIMPGNDPGGVIVTMLLGVVGSVLAMVIGRAVGIYDEPNEAPGFIASVIGAIAVLAIYRGVTRRRGLLRG